MTLCGIIKHLQPLVQSNRLGFLFPMPYLAFLFAAKLIYVFHKISPLLYIGILWKYFSGNGINMRLEDIMKK